MPPAFAPVLYVKTGCPHCFKLQLFLLEAGLINRFELRAFTPGDDSEPKLRSELAMHFAKVTFSTVQFAPGQYANESDAIIARYADEAGIDPAGLPLFVAYADGLLPRLQRLNREDKDLKAQLGAG